MSKLLEALGDKTHAAWFEESNTEAMPGEETPGLDTSEFLDALKKLGFRKKQTKHLKAYLDPDADGDVDIDEFNAKVATKDEVRGGGRAKRGCVCSRVLTMHESLTNTHATLLQPLAMDAFENSVGNAMGKLEKHMKKGYMRISDLFRKVDKDGGGEIDSAEMKAFFVKLAQPSKAALARAKKAAERKALSKPMPEEEVRQRGAENEHEE